MTSLAYVFPDFVNFWRRLCCHFEFWVAPIVFVSFMERFGFDGWREASDGFKYFCAFSRGLVLGWFVKLFGSYVGEIVGLVCTGAFDGFGKQY